MKPNTRKSHTLQVWPSGKGFEYQGDPDGPADQKRLRERDYNSRKQARWRKGTNDEWRAIRHNVRAVMYQDRDVLCCDSALVDDLLKLSNDSHGDLAEAFSIDAIENLYADPSEWTLEQCREYAQDHSLDAPDPDPWTMGREALVELLKGVSIDVQDDEAIETLREAVIVNMDDDTIDGLDDWRNVCRDHAQDNPGEVYEWWRVTGWLCKQLRAISEVVIDNDYGSWWGRQATGQQYLMDGTLQRVAARFD